MPYNILNHAARAFHGGDFPLARDLEERRKTEEVERLKKEEIERRQNQINIPKTLETIRSSLHGGQVELFDDISTREIGVAAGYGAGKTLGACAKAFQLATLNQGFVGCVLEPTGPMLRDIWVRKFDAFLDEYKIPYTFRSSPLPEHVLHLPGGDTPILARSFENFKRIVGPDWAWALSDEVDTVQEKIADKSYKKILGRIRVGIVRQIVSLSTPEGFAWHYKTFGTEEARSNPKKRLIRMRTQDNPHLPQDYLDNLRDAYTESMLKAYMDGVYINLTSGQVYDRFDRDLHIRPLKNPVQKTERIILGVDFNIRNMSGVLLVMRAGELHAFDEIAGSHDTDDLAKEVRKRYPENHIEMYPDASGRHASTNSNQTDIGILKGYRFVDRSPLANPGIKNRVNVVQAALKNGKGETRLWISPNCVKTIESLERQSYNDKGEPDKTSGYDHMNDALGYPVHEIFASVLGLKPGGLIQVSTVIPGRGV